MSNTKLYRIILAVLSGLLLGLAFPPIPTGVTATVAFVPFFLLFESIEEYGRAFRYAYFTFFIFNLVTLYWTAGFTHGKDVYMMIAGSLLMIVHPFFFIVPVLAWLFFRRQFGFKTSLFVFPFLWVAFEYLHTLWEISFPWLTLGNTQTYDLAIVQFASFTGVHGISFWLLWLNVIAFILLAKLATNEWKFRSMQSTALVGLFLLLYFIPKIYGSIILQEPIESGKNKVELAIIQPNIDTFEKWSGDPYKPLGMLQSQTNEIAGRSIDLVLWPETAPPFYVLHPANIYFLNQLKMQVNQLNINLLTGIPDIYYYSGDEKYPRSSKTSVDGQRYDTYNSSMLLQPNSIEVQKYAKINLVPFAERVPFSEQLSFLNAMQWNFGLGGWGIGKDTTVFHFKIHNGNEVKFSNMICYESIYPDFVSGFVRKGAQFLTVITNDSWWGNTSGTYQHKQFAILRAVENRRWIAQCANGGISCIIDPHGNIHQQTEMYTRDITYSTIETYDDLTFFTEHGDWFGWLCLFMSLLFIVSASGKKFYLRIRRQQELAVQQQNTSDEGSTI